MGLPRATAFRFGQGHFEAVSNFYFNSRRDQKRARQIHALKRVAILFLGLRHDAPNAPSPAASKVRQEPWNHKGQEGWHKHPHAESCVESLLLKQNTTLIYLRNVKSFVFRPGHKVPHCQKWDCHALPLFALDRAISRRFPISILIAGETKNGRAKSTRWSVWQSCFWGCDMTLRTHPAASKVRQEPWNHKGQEGWHKHPHAELGGPPFRSPNSMSFPTPKTGMEQIEQFSDIILRILRFLAESSGVIKLELFQSFPHCK